MRDELRNIATIEEYLSGELPLEQVSIIENKIEADADFALNVSAQREITNHFKVRAFKEAVQTYQVKYTRIKAAKSIGIILLALIAIGFAAYLFISSSETASTKTDSIQTKAIAVESSKTKLDASTGNYSVNPLLKQQISRQKSQSKQAVEEKQSTKIDSVDNTVDLLARRGVSMILPTVKSDIVDLIMEAPKPLIKGTQERTIWRIEDRFASYFKEAFIPFKVTSNNKDLNLTYSFTAVRGSTIIVTLIDPEGNEIEVLNMAEKFEDLEVKDQLDFDHINGKWKVKIKTIGLGYFLMKVNSNE